MPNLNISIPLTDNMLDTLMEEYNYDELSEIAEKAIQDEFKRLKGELEEE